jgi:hypothetical protein
MVQRLAWEVLARPVCSPDLAPYGQWLFARVEQYQGKDLNRQKINAVVIVSLHRLSEGEYRDATDCLPYRREKFVGNASDSVE